MEKGTCFSYLDLFLFVCVNLLILCTSLTIMMMIVKLLEKIFME